MLELNSVTIYDKIFSCFQMNWLNILIISFTDLVEEDSETESITDIVFLLFAFAFPYVLPEHVICL